MFIKYPYKIQIYRITSFGSIYFRYEGDYYLVHNSSNEEVTTTLYKRIMKGNGHYSLETLKYIWGDVHFKSCEVRPYKFINKNRFVFELTQFGFCESIYSKSVRRINKRIEELQKRIYELQKEVDRLRNI